MIFQMSGRPTRPHQRLWKKNRKWSTTNNSKYCRWTRKLSKERQKSKERWVRNTSKRCNTTDSLIINYCAYSADNQDLLILSLKLVSNQACDFFEVFLFSLTTEKPSNLVGLGKAERSLLPRIHGCAKNEDRQAKTNYQKERRHPNEEN